MTRPDMTPDDMDGVDMPPPEEVFDPDRTYDGEGTTCAASAACGETRQVCLDGSCTRAERLDLESVRYDTTVLATGVMPGAAGLLGDSSRTPGELIGVEASTSTLDPSGLGTARLVVHYGSSFRCHVTRLSSSPVAVTVPDLVCTAGALLSDGSMVVSGARPGSSQALAVLLDPEGNEVERLEFENDSVPLEFEGTPLEADYATFILPGSSSHMVAMVYVDAAAPPGRPLRTTLDQPHLMGLAELRFGVDGGRQFRASRQLPVVNANRMVLARSASETTAIALLPQAGAAADDPLIIGVGRIPSDGVSPVSFDELSRTSEGTLGLAQLTAEHWLGWVSRAIPCTNSSYVLLDPSQDLRGVRFNMFGVLEYQDCSTQSPTLDSLAGEGRSIGRIVTTLGVAQLVNHAAGLQFVSGLEREEGIELRWSASNEQVSNLLQGDFGNVFVLPFSRYGVTLEFALFSPESGRWRLAELAIESDL